MTIMIIGSEEEYHARYIYDRLQERGTSCFYLDTRTFPTSLQLSLSPNQGGADGCIITPEGQKIVLSDIQTVYWRYHHGIEVSPNIPTEVSGIVYREIESAIGSLFRNMTHTLWVNPASAIERHRYKTHQLALMAQAGIPIPDTLVGNDGDAVMAFFDKHDGNVIYKPVAGGAHTAKLTREDLTPERIQELSVSPVQFQEMIPGVDVRVYGIGEELFAAEIQAGTLDFRDNPDAPIVPVSIPDEVATHCLKIMDLFEYKFTGIDLRHTPDGRYVFLEANPSPMFVHFANVTGYPIVEKLLELLESGLKS